MKLSIGFEETAWRANRSVMEAETELTYSRCISVTESGEMPCTTINARDHRVSPS